MKKQDFPPGWNEERVRKVIAYYDQQSEDEELAELEAAFDNPGQTMMAVPTELVPVIAGLIEAHQQQTANRTRGRRTTKERPKKAQKAQR